jgi:hypothetical protein
MKSCVGSQRASFSIVTMTNNSAILVPNNSEVYRIQNDAQASHLANTKIIVCLYLWKTS